MHFRNLFFSGLSIFLIISSFQTNAQLNGIISGHVKNAITGVGLQGVNLELKNTPFNSTTDKDGLYIIKGISQGKYMLRVTFTGFKEIVKEVNIQAGEKKEVNFFLHPEAVQLKEVTVKSRASDLVGIANSASEGFVGYAQLKTRPILRTGEIMETVPGLIVTQHSGPGKANQFFFRGLNLDHGTDFSTSIDGMPLNLPTHAHGQGYLDLGFLIPELIDYISFKKGPYYPDAGDFSATGTAKIKLKNYIKQGSVEVKAGFDNYYRGLFANSSKIGDNNLLYGFSYQYYDGPFVFPNKENKFSGVLKYSGGNTEKGFSFTAIGYHNKWNSTDQIPKRAVKSGEIDRLGAIDTTDGGNTNRYSLIYNWWNTKGRGETHLTAYLSYYDLDLFSNFTYYLEHPNEGDQIEQADQRLYGGIKGSHKWQSHWFGQKNTNTIGLDIRHDQIFEVGLYNTTGRIRFNTISSDEVPETNVGLYYINETKWTNKFRTYVGARANYYHFNVRSNVDVNSGNRSAFIAGPKVGLTFGPWAQTELYADLGLGFHSNDARGTTLKEDPISHDPLDAVDPLVRSRGAEIGIRTSAIKGLQSTLAAFYLGLNSELVFDGDAGGTEASDASQHYGIEWSNFYQPIEWLILNLDMSFVHSQFVDVSKEEDKIPNSIGRIISAGLVLGNHNEGLMGSFRLRHFGPRPLTEDGSVTSNATTLMNAEIAYRFKHFKIILEILNIFNAKDSDIAYYYESRLRGEPAVGIEDIHFHPALPRTARLALNYRF